VSGRQRHGGELLRVEVVQQGGRRNRV
jgi:hypothetical protein